MPSMTGIVMIVQESRFQLIDDDGVGHLFLLGANAAAEPAQLAALQRRQSRVRVVYRTAGNMIGNVAEKVVLF